MSAVKAATVVALLNAERIKLASVRSPLWTGVLAAVLGLGLAAVQGSNAYGAAGLAPESAAIGVGVFVVPVLMVLSATVVTGEYRSGMIRATFAATPNRALVMAAKAAVAASCSGAYVAVLVAAAIVTARLTADPLAGRQLSLTEPAVWRVVWAMTVFAMLAAVLGIAVGALVRHTAGAVALLLLWPLVVEPIVANMPNVSTEVGPYLPFVNAFVYTDVPWLFPTYPMPWSQLGSAAYFAFIVAATFVAATVVVNRRDA